MHLEARNRNRYPEEFTGGSAPIIGKCFGARDVAAWRKMCCRRDGGVV